MKSFLLAAFTGITLWGIALWGAALYQEPFRPQYHFSPAKTWMNDPNGLVWYKGEYHLFFQNNPFGNKPAHISWGHAVSADLLHWKELPVAIPEESGIMIFSGSAVVDHNTSGFCENPDPKDDTCLVAMYTGDSKTLETQNIAFSNDRGRTWTKYKGNPVIDLNMKDFRDPKVMWYEPAKSWVVTIAVPNEHKVKFFGSKNLVQWTALGEFGPAGATGGQWECPDLFQLDGKWVLIVNVNPGGIHGGSATQYFVGNFDGKTFQNDVPQGETKWADWGKDFYAAVTYFNAPPGDTRKILQGWFSNWEYAPVEPTEPQRGAMEVPRELSLQGGHLVSTPIRELAGLRGKEMKKAFRGQELEIDVSYDLNKGGGPAPQEFGVAVFKGGAEQTLVGVTADGRVFIDRTKSGNVAFSPTFSGRHSSAPLRDAKKVRLHIFVDRSTVEVFANDGEVAISDRVFPSAGSDGVEFYATGGQARISSKHVWPMNSIW